MKERLTRVVIFWAMMLGGLSIAIAICFGFYLFENRFGKENFQISVFSLFFIGMTILVYCTNPSEKK